MAYPGRQYQQQIAQNQQQIAANQQRIQQQQMQPQYAQQPMGQQPQVVYAQPPPQQQVQYVQQPMGQPQYAQPQQPVQYVQQPMGQPQYAQPQQPVQYVQQPQYGQPVQQQRVQYVQQPMQPQYAQPQQPQYAQPQQPQYAQPVQQQPTMYAQPVQQVQQGGVYQKPAGGPPTYNQHKVNKYQKAEQEMKQQNKPSGGYGGSGAGGSNKGWSQPLQDARGTCPAMQNFNDEVARENSQKLYKAMKGMGTNEQAMVDVTGKMNSAQRLRVRQIFERDYCSNKTFGDKTLLKWIKGELSGSKEGLFIALYKSLPAYDAWWINKDENVLREILCTRTNQQIIDMQAAWFKGTDEGRNRAAELFGDKYRDKNKYPDQWFRVAGEVKGKTMREYVLKKYTKSGHFTGHGNERELYSRLLDANRPPNGPLDQQKVRQDAETLNRFLTQSKGHEAKAKFIEVFTSRSWNHIAAISNSFMDVSKKLTMDAAMKKAFNGISTSDTYLALSIIHKFATQPYDYWAQKLRDSMKGMGTKDDDLIRIIVTRSEIDMYNIKTIFGNRYGDGKTLQNWIKGDTSKYYQKMLLYLTGYMD